MSQFIPVHSSNESKRETYMNLLRAILSYLIPLQIPETGYGEPPDLYVLVCTLLKYTQFHSGRAVN